MSRLQPCIHYGGAPSYIPARSHIDSNRMKSNNNSNNKIRVQWRSFVDVEWLYL